MFKVRAGSVEEYAKGVVSFADRNDIDLKALAELVTAIAAGLESGHLAAR